MGEKWPRNFAESGDFHVTFGFFYIPVKHDMGQTALLPPPKEGVLRIFSPEKSDGFGRV
jgi:hypothetical protein